MESFEVLDGRGAAKVEQVFADAEVTSTVAFPRADVSEGVFDRGPFTESSAAGGGLLKRAELSLPGFVFGDGHGSSMAGGGLCTLGAEGTSSASFGVEFDRIARLEGLHFTGGARVSSAT